jgi:hypothetical protein
VLFGLGLGGLVGITAPPVIATPQAVYVPPVPATYPAGYCAPVYY